MRSRFGLTKSVNRTLDVQTFIWTLDFLHLPCPLQLATSPSSIYLLARNPRLCKQRGGNIVISRPSMATFWQWHWLKKAIAIFGQWCHLEYSAPLFTGSCQHVRRIMRQRPSSPPERFRILFNTSSTGWISALKIVTGKWLPPFPAPMVQEAIPQGWADGCKR